MTTSEMIPARRAVFTELGEDSREAIEKFLRIEEQPAPDPADCRPDEVIVRVESCAVSWIDLVMATGQYQHRCYPPYIPGVEYSGTVLWAGSAVDASQIAVGDRVLSDFIACGPRSKTEYQSAGGFAGYAVVPAAALCRIPEGLDFDQAANLLASYETAYHCLITRGQMQPGETVLIHGASGASGLAAVQICRMMGVNVIATGRYDDKLEIVRGQGADHTINTRNPDGSPGLRSFRDEVKDLTGGKGVDLVFDTVGGDISLESLRCVSFGARFLIVGWTATPDVADGKGRRGSPRANLLPTNLMQMKGLTVMGCPAVITIERNPALREPRKSHILEWAGAGKIAPLVSKTFAMDEAREALLARWTGGFTGGMALRPWEGA
ncbi:NADPH:quinone oxidoreductase family protein [Oceanicola sp. 22II-s10i]|uniref:NADPH:quinone oxidoreductase family protein n=1 Tax=Oceanicola sp. 22II-s10i TaxID=1317116 RepID=UPI000B522C38|nr:NADPH:quinone oxidoreductase family protein [Oceanicola sp. 22II-s10i]